MEDLASLHRFGTPLEPLDEETAVKEKPKYIEDEIVTDENGRRRFHGAFTGGFSAGYWNTVGSQEGWVPKSFKSSRSEKAGRIEQKPSDFMDDEDLGEFGIAPTTYEVRKEYSDGIGEDRGTKRKLQQPSSTIGPDTIDLLQKLFKPIQNTIGVEILKSWGWKPGQGVGPRQTKKEKKQAAEFNKRQMYIMKKYGCSTSSDIDMGTKEESDTSDEDEENDEITFAPDDFEDYIANPKLDKFGIGYTGLSRDPVLSNDKSKGDQHFSLFTPLEIMGKNNKKLSITGQAFGVGALEEEDEDIYEKEDMSKYDFSLDDKKEKDKKKKKSEKHVQDVTVLEGFVPAKDDETLNNEPIYDVVLPKGYKPRNWAIRKSRFSPIDEKQLQVIERKFNRTSRKSDLTPEERGRMLDEQPVAHASTEVVDEKNDAVLIESASTSEIVKEKPKSYLEKVNEKYKSREDKTKELLERISAKSFGFVRGGIIATDGKEKETERESSTTSKEIASISSSGSFKPFQYDEAKQLRYDKFIEANVSEEKDIHEFLSSVQPVHMSEWDREMEKKEFIQAKKLYKPLQGIMANRFVSEATVVEEAPKKDIIKDCERSVTVVRTKTTWKPSSHLCKRYNIADPFGGTLDEEKTQRQGLHKSSKLSVFDYLEGSMNTKSNFVTPVIIPKHLHLPKEIVKNALSAKNTESTEQMTFNEKLNSEPSTSKTMHPHASTEDPQKPSKELETKPPTNEDEVRKEEECGPPTEALRRLTFVPKTELEKRVVESKDLPPSEKKELFKAIFDDSDDDENEDKESKIEEIPDVVQAPTKPSVPVNILRNTSPPRGIFAALFTVNPKESEKSADTIDEKKDESEYEPPPKIKFQPKDKRIEHTLDESKAPDSESLDNIYGPAVPTNLQPRVEAKAESSTVSISAEKRIKYKGVEIIEEWVEKKALSSTDESEDSESSSNSSPERKSKKSKKSKKSSSKKEKKSKKKKRKKSKSSKHKKR